MSASILGKRNRGAAEPVERASPRSKRRLVVNGDNDENENPFVLQESNKNHEDEEDGARKLQKIGRTRISRARQTISPSTATSLQKVIKSDIHVFEDVKSDEAPTPKTPRHRDVVSKKVPITPRHKFLVNENQPTSRTPKTPSTGSTAIYNQARQLFSRSSNPGRLVKRDEERADLSAFISTRLESKSAGCMYISGPPGTGKSALVQEVLQQYEDSNNVKVAVVNCMSVRNTKDLSGKLSEDLGLQEDAGFDYLRSCFASRKGQSGHKFLVILDEVDQLVDLDLELLYGLFEWSMQASSRLILIGIANALDLTDRLLPRLKSRNLKPELLPFMPYSAAQITDIITTKLRSLSADDSLNVPFLHPAAIQLCAKKVASQTGDLRKAFDICRRAIDLAEKETREKDARLHLEQSPSKTPLMENINLSSPPTPKSPDTKTVSAYTIETAPKATIAHVAKVTAQVFGNGTTQRLSSLNLQQKAVLCSLSALEKRKRDTQVEKAMFATPSKHNSAAPSIKQLFGAYTQLCSHDNLLHPLTAVEFRDVVSGLEALSLISGADGKMGSFAVPITPSRTPSRLGRAAFNKGAIGDERRVASTVGSNELSNALDGPGGDLLRAIMNGDVLL